jgi:ribonuclease P protein component
VLPAAHRLTDAASFRDAGRRGRRAAGSFVVVHARRPSVATQGTDGPARVGFVVSKAVGNAVVRNRVKRRLRHALVPVVPDLAAGTIVVVRALPASAGASGAELAADVAGCLRRATGAVPA